MSLVEIRDVSKAFGGVQAVSRVSVDVQKGQILSIIGPNGAGKTTLLNCISSVFHPETGTIVLEGQDLTRLSPPRVATLGVARTFQNIALFRGMTVVDNLMLGRHIHMKNGVLRSMLCWGPGRREEVAHRPGGEGIIDLLEIEAIRQRPVGSLPDRVQKRGGRGPG